MKLFFDTEFTGLQKDTSLISLGIVAENGQCFYAKFTDYNKEQVNDWIQEHIIENLELTDELLANFYVTEVTGTKEEIKEALLKWLESLEADYFELVSDVCHYDMVLFVDIFGGAFDLPEFISPCCYDINQDIFYMLQSDMSMKTAFDTNREQLLKQLTEYACDELYEIGESVLSLGEECKHNALYDALIIRAIHYCIYYNLKEEGYDL